MKAEAKKQASTGSAEKKQKSEFEKMLEGRPRIHSLSALYSKEMSDQITSRRFIIVILLVLISTMAGIYAASSGIADAISSDSNFVFLKMYTTSGNSIPSYTSFMALIGPFVGLMMGFDAINSERSNNTLNRLLAQPIYRDNIIVGKFLAGMSVIAIMTVSSCILVGTVGFLQIGLLPSSEEIARVLVYALYTIVYISFWLAMSMLFSVYSRHAATSALASIALWVVFAVFMSMIANLVANSIYPINTEYQQYFNTLKNYNCELLINRLSPYYLYSEAVSTILNPGVRAVNAVTMSQLVGAVSSYLPFGQSLMLVWPHLFGLAALTLAVFTVSYFKFMRQEVRSN